METFLLNFLDNIGNINFQTIGIILAAIFIIFWLIVLDWVWQDAGERTSSTAVRVIYLLPVLLFNILGWILYLIIRPSQTIEQIYWSDLERRYLKFETQELGDCPKCGTQLYPGYIYCPECGLELKIKCYGCEVYIDKSNEYCPYCGKRVEKQIVQKEILPTKEIMEQQIQASKEEAAKVVDSEQTRYSVKKRSLTVKLGRAIIGGYKILFHKLKEAFIPNEVVLTDTEEITNRKNKKHHKNKKH